MFRRYLTFVVIAILVFGAGAALAATHRVTSGTALDAAFWAAVEDGDTIILMDDVSVAELPNLTDKSIVIKSGSDSVATINVGTNRFLWANESSGPLNTVTLDGVKITGGTGNSLGGGLRANLGYAPAMPYPAITVVFKNHSEISCNTADGINSGTYTGDMFEGFLAPSYRGIGGGMIAHSATIEGDSVVFRDNTATAAGATPSTPMGGVFIAGAGGGLAVINQLNMEAENIIFTGNRASDESDDGFYEEGAGGGMWTSYATITAKNVTFSDNTAYTRHGGTSGDVDEGGLGGAIYTGVMTITADAMTFKDNKAQGEGDHTGYGGAIYATQTVTLDGDVLFDGNVASGKTYSSGKGGAIYSNGELHMTGSAIFRNNTAQGENGHSGLGGAVISRYFSLENASFTGNKAISDGTSNYSGLGGAIYFHTQGYTHSGRPDDTENIGTIRAGSGLETVFHGNTDGDSTTRRRNSIYMGTYETNANPSAIMALQTGTLNLSAAADGMISFYDPIASDARAHQIVVNPNAQDIGVVRFWGDNEYYGHTTVGNGTMFLMEAGDLGQTVYGRKGENAIGGGTLDSVFTVKSTGTLGLAVDSVLHADTFTSEAGAKLAVNASQLQGAHTYANIVQTSNAVTVADTMAVKTDLVTAALVANGVNADLVVTVANAANVWGGDYAVIDILRLSTLPDAALRQWLNTAMSSNLSDLDTTTLQALRGDGVAMGHVAHTANTAMFRSAIDSHMRSLWRDTDLAAGGGITANAALASPRVRSGLSSASRIWAGIGGNSIHQDNAGGRSGYKYDPFGLTLGYDRECGAWLFGAAFQYNKGDVKARNGSAKTEVDSALGAVYAAFRRDGFYATAGVQAGMGWNEAKTCYTALGQSAHGKYDSTLFGANLELGYDFALGCTLRVTPHAGLEYANIRTDAFSEKSDNGAPTRRFDKTHGDFIDIPVGIAVARDFAVGCSTITPYIDAAYVRSVGDANNSVTASFIGLPGNAWTASDVKSKRDAFRIKAGVAASLNNRTQVALTYAAELRNGYRNHFGQFTISCGF